jgi:hypothetical protein
MQHQTLPDAPKTNEGIPNWDLLVILFARWIRPSPPPTPKTMDKKRRKLIQMQQPQFFNHLNIIF